MTEEHTPGPWQFYADVPSTDPNWHIVTNASRMRVLANVHIEPGNATDLANARLIAVAPDLLAALKELRYACTDKAEAMADAAIGKATGVLTPNAELTCRRSSEAAEGTLPAQPVKRSG